MVGIESLSRRSVVKATAVSIGSLFGVSSFGISAHQDTPENQPVPPDGWQLYYGIMNPVHTYIPGSWTPVLFKARNGTHHDRFSSELEVTDYVSTTVNLATAPIDTSYNPSNVNQRLWDIALSEQKSLPPNMLSNIAAISLPDTDETFAAIISTSLDDMLHSPIEIYPRPSVSFSATYYSLMFEQGDFTCFMRATIPDGMEQELEDLIQVAGFMQINPNWREPEILF